LVPLILWVPPVPLVLPVPLVPPVPGYLCFHWFLMFL
jgi:hypothetical protein